VLQSLHSLGLRVVLDVVYNHTFASGPYSQNSVLVSNMSQQQHLCRAWQGSQSKMLCTIRTIIAACLLTQLWSRMQ
jgi:hypothetical protein